MKNARDFLTPEQQAFLLALAEEGVRVTGREVTVVDTGSMPQTEERPGIGDDYLDICGNLEDFRIKFEEEAEFYIVVQDGPVIELINDYYITDKADAIYAQLEKRFI